ncbi:MAG: TrbI/VirB10 family protein [Sphingomonadales bacterium]|nr:TrbI/VirB10 family protein [Sphingomonadales bacterium]MDE2570257.1 TrbI/VirB10 family protein [Sphingomonadales bacterium]
MTDTPPEPPQPEVQTSAPKSDPEGFALRAQPARAIRFKRNVIIAIAAGASVLVAGTTWFALRNHHFGMVQPGEDDRNAARAPTDVVNDLPSNYSQVPKLGPPLPGDLGKAILDHQKQAMIAPVQMQPAAPSAGNATIEDNAAKERGKARQSPLLVRTTRTATSKPTAQAQPPGTASAQLEAKLPQTPEQDLNRQDEKVRFASARDTGSYLDQHALMPAASADLLSAGSVIAASLVTGIRSDLPGLVVAQVTEQVFDSATGRVLLIPQGARLIGKYDSTVTYGQRRALIVWERIVMPNGSSIGLDKVPATDPSGYSGLADKVDSHTWTLIKGAVISTLLGVGSNVKFGGESDLAQAIRQSSQQSVSRAGDQLTTRNLQVQPTITIRPGTPVRLVVQRDLILAPWHEEP